MEGWSEMIRTKLNDRGANIGKLWGYMVRQSHDPFTVTGGLIPARFSISVCL